MTNSISTTDQLVLNVYRAVEIAVSKKSPVVIDFSPDSLTVEVAEIISSYLDDLSTVEYNFDARRAKLTLIPKTERIPFFIDDTCTGRLH